MYNEVVSLVIRWPIPVLCCAQVSGYFGKAKAMREGVRSLLRAEIIQSYEKYTDRGYCPIYARETLTKAYEAYHAMGGNGTGTDFYKKTMALPTGEVCKQ